jgi:hypothetical protein
MLFTFVNLVCISATIFGFSSVKRKIFNDNKKIKNQDFIFGVIFISMIALIGNFFLPLKFFSIFIIFFGLILFLFNFFKKNYELNFLSYLIILFLFCFFTHNNSLNYDSPFYHLQIIKWSSEYKISFGLVNLEQRYAMPSIWHQFLSLFNYKILGFNPVYLVSLIIFSLFFNQAINKKEYKKLSNLYIIFVNFFLFFFSLIHPFQDGIIFNHLGSPESDIIGIVFFSYSFYFFIKILEDKKIEDFYYLLIFVFYGILTKISYAYLGFLLLSSIFIFKKNIFKNKKIFFALTAVLFFWFIRNLIISGCFIFPISFTCFDFSWNNINEIEYFLNEAKSWSRSTRLRINAANFEYTLNSFEWFIPWFKDYYMNTSILKILSITFLFSSTSLLIGIFLNNLKFKEIINKNNLTILIFVILGIYGWMQVPEVRYGHGLIILLIFLNFLIFVKSFKINFQIEKMIKISSFMILFLLCVKNYTVINTFNKNFSREFDYTNFIKIKNDSKFEIYSPNPESLDASETLKFCGNFKGICGYLNHPTKLENLKISKNIYGYLIFMN